MPVATEVHEPPTEANVALQCVKDIEAHIFGVAPGDDDAVFLEYTRTLRVKLVVGQDVVGVAETFEPVDQIDVLAEVDRAVEKPETVSRIEVDDGTARRGVADAGAVAVVVVQREPELAMRRHLQVLRRRHAGHALEVPHLLAHMLVGIGEVGKARHEHGDLRPSLGGRRHDEKGHVARSGGVRHDNGVHAASKRARQLDL